VGSEDVVKRRKILENARMIQDQKMRKLRRVLNENYAGIVEDSKLLWCFTSI